MRGAALVAIAATIGNFLQGWDNATIAGTNSLCFFYFIYLFIFLFLCFSFFTNFSTAVFTLIDKSIQFFTFTIFFFFSNERGLSS